MELNSNVVVKPGRHTSHIGYVDPIYAWCVFALIGSNGTCSPNKNNAENVQRTDTIKFEREELLLTCCCDAFLRTSIGASSFFGFYNNNSI